MINNFTDLRASLQSESLDHDVSLIIDTLDEILDVADSIKTAIFVDKDINIWNQQFLFISKLSNLDSLVEGANLPSLKHQVIDLCDAGPGVGLMNHAVMYRVCAEIEICKLDYYARIHPR